MLSYAKREFDFTNRPGIIKLSGTGTNRVYVIKDKRNIHAAKTWTGIKQAAVCACGTIYAWRGREPDCPGCGKRDIKEVYPYDKNAFGYEDGVYVDVSRRNLEVTIGFAVVKDQQAQLLSCMSNFPDQTAKAEFEAVDLANQYWPGMQVWCDHEAACRGGRAKYVHRQRNKLAHKAARERVGFTYSVETNDQSN